PRAADLRVDPLRAGARWIAVRTVAFRGARSNRARVPDTRRDGVRRCNEISDPDRLPARLARSSRVRASYRAPLTRLVKVLHVHRIGGIGGSERHLLTLLPALAERGFDVSFLGLDDPARAPDPFYEALNVPYERLSAPRDLDPLLALHVG